MAIMRSGWNTDTINFEGQATGLVKVAHALSDRFRTVQGDVMKAQHSVGVALLSVLDMGNAHLSSLGPMHRQLANKLQYSQTDASGIAIIGGGMIGLTLGIGFGLFIGSLVSGNQDTSRAKGCVVNTIVGIIGIGGMLAGAYVGWELARKAH